MKVRNGVKAELKCQDIPLHTVETEAVYMIKRIVYFLVNKLSAVTVQYMYMLIYLVLIVPSSVPACGLQSPINTGLEREKSRHCCRGTT